MLLVLGPLRSGCTTFLKSLAGKMNGLRLDSWSSLNYQGINFDHMHRNFRGETIYTPEQDQQFPMLTVGETLYFAARARSPRHVPGNVSHSKVYTTPARCRNGYFWNQAYDEHTSWK